MSGERWRRIEAAIIDWFRSEDGVTLDGSAERIAEYSITEDFPTDWNGDGDRIITVNLTDLARHLDRELPQP